MITILDCYTDEPAGLGVPPYLGTYPRYIAGSIDEPIIYLTIDDLRLYKNYNSIIPKTKLSQKTNIKVYNLTKNYKNIKDILQKTEKLIVILGVHTPGKYPSALPGTLKEVSELIKDIDCEKVLTGPAFHGTTRARIRQDGDSDAGGFRDRHSHHQLWTGRRKRRRG